MNENLAIVLHSTGLKEGVPFSIGTIPFVALQSVVSEIPKVLFGSTIAGKDKSVLKDALSISFEEGSVRIGAIVAMSALTLLQDTSFASDIRAIAENRLRDVVDQGRLTAISEIRDCLRTQGAKTFAMASGFAKVDETDLLNRDLTPCHADSVWVESDAYVRATVMDLGGKTSSNAHLELEDGETLKADTSRSYLFDLKENMIYKSVIAHVSYPLNLKTREWDRSQVKLLSIELPETNFDRAEFDTAISGYNGWREIADPIAEIRRMRSANG